MSDESTDRRDGLAEEGEEDLALEDDSADAVRGGDSVAVNKAKTANKSAEAMDAYLRQ